MRARLSSASHILSNRLWLLLMLGWGAYGPILGNRLPHADDLGYHMPRLAQLADLVRQGMLFSRWFPDLAHGYGYPLLNYVAPLPYYIALPFKLVGFSVPTALQLSFALGIVLAGWTMQRFLRDWLPALPALAGGVALMYAPYFSYDVLFRSNFGESMAIFWMPLALWGVGRAVRGGGWRWVAVGGLAYAGVILSHNISALVFSGVLGVVGLALTPGPLALWERGPGGEGRLRLLATLAIGLAVAAFFWLPALAETDAIAYERLANNAFYNVRNHFQPWSELLALPGVVYRDRINPSPPPALGLLPVLLGLSGWLLFWRAPAPARRHLTLFTLLLAGFLFMLRPFSLPLWEALPLIDFLQFPWRLLAVATILPPVLIGWSLHLWGEALPLRWRALPPLLGMALLMAAAQPWLVPPYGSKPAELSIADIVPYEVATDTLGTTALGEYLPATVREVPAGPPDWQLRLANGQIERVTAQPLGLTAQISASGAQSVTVSQFMFPGWWASVNGRRVPVSADAPHGLLTFSVPTGRSVVAVGFGPTPLRWAALAVSLVGLLAALVAFRADRAEKQMWATEENASLSRPVVVALLGLGVLAGVVLPALRPARLTADGSVRGAQMTPLAFDGGLLLLDVDLPSAVAADGAADVTLIWRAEQTPAAELWTTVALRDAAGVLWSAKQSAPPPRFRRAIPTNAWPTDRYAVDVQRVVPLAGTPPGRYDVVLTLFERATLRPLPLRGSTTTQVVIGALTVTRPARPPDLSPAVVLDVALDNGLTLLGYATDRTAARPGDPLLLTLSWQAGGKPPAAGPLLLRLTLAAFDGGAAQTVDVPLDWTWVQPGDRWQTQHALRLPADLVGGRYRWQVAVCRPLCRVGQGLAAVAVDAPERLVVPPAVNQLVETALGPAATLYGVSTAQTEGTLTVAPVWLATATMTTSYRAFVHVLTADGTLIAQSDAEPGQWSRPTTGWLPGEYVVDRHDIRLAQLPAGARLRIGLYEPETGIWPGPPVELALEQ